MYQHVWYFQCSLLAYDHKSSPPNHSNGQLIALPAAMSEAALSQIALPEALPDTEYAGRTPALVIA